MRQLDFEYIDTSDALNRVLSCLQRANRVAIDTEFMRTTTLNPIVGLVQLNVDNTMGFLIDATMLDLCALWGMLHKIKRVVFHAASEDLEIIYLAGGRNPLTNCFDTQIALSYLGEGLQMSYQNALQLKLGVHVDKGETLSDWLARPLREEQKQYAANDVLFLLDLHDVLVHELQQKGIYTYVQEDSQYQAIELANVTELFDLHKEIGSFMHTRQQLMQIEQLAVWREHLCRALNEPRSFVFKNNVIVAIIEAAPRNLYELGKIKGIRSHVLKEHGKTILDLLWKLPAHQQWPQRLPRPLRGKNNAINHVVDEFVAALSLSLLVPKEVLLRKKWLTALYEKVAFDLDDQYLPLPLLGWRYEVLTQPLATRLVSHQADLHAALMPFEDRYDL